mmetsp:Transcript_107577/g.304910  ORF Transcript_107577/g.304910 Transcript_107577/m.304910 type:complete len:313 (+) Transcript_107577:2688-3626(+)
MVLHVAGVEPVVLLGLLQQFVEVVVRAFELGEHLHQRLRDHVRKHVEAATVRHSNDALVGAQLGRLLEGRVNPRDRGFRTVHAETLCCFVLVVQELLERIHLAELFVNLHQLRLVLRDEVWALHAHPDPVQDLVVANVHVLDPHAAAVGLVQRCHDVLQRGVAREPSEGNARRLVHVGLGEAVELRVKLGDANHRALGPRIHRLLPGAPLVQAQGVHVGRLVALHLVGSDEALDAGASVDGASRVAVLVPEQGRAALPRRCQLRAQRRGPHVGARGRRRRRPATLQAREVLAPLGIEFRGIGLPLRVDVLEV